MTESVLDYMTRLGRAAREASRVIGRASTAQKNRALQAAADALDAARAELTAANELDLAAGRASGLEPAMLDRLALTPAVIDGMIEGLRQVATLPDPIGAIRDMRYMPSGIQVGKMRVPLGVVGIIYESRPNVTIDAASLCLKSGNATILRGGSEAIHSNQAIARCIQLGLAEAGLPAAAVQVVDTTDRAAVGALISMPDYVDVIVPRGGKGLIERISRDARVPVIKHLDGICHVYVDVAADVDKAIRIADNAKTQRYAPCNTMETLLVHQGIADRVLPPLAAIYREKGVELRGCARTQALLGGDVLQGVHLDAMLDLGNLGRDQLGADTRQQAQALVAEGRGLHRNALLLEFLQLGQGDTADVGVQTAAQTLVGRDHHHAHGLDLTLDQVGMGVLGIGLHQVRGDLAHLGGVRTASAHPFLRLAHLGCGDHFHRLGDLARILYALDLCPYLFSSGHIGSPYFLERSRTFKVLDRSAQCSFVFLREILGVFNTADQISKLAL